MKRHVLHTQVTQPAKLLLALALALSLALVSVESAEAAPKTYPIVVSSDGLNVRGDPSTKNPPIGSLGAKNRVEILCTAQGETVSGPLGVISLWDNIGGGRWINDSFVRTGVPQAVAPPCEQSSDGPIEGGPSEGAANSQYQGLYDQAFGPKREGDTRLDEPLDAPSTPDSGLVMARFYIPSSMAAAGLLKGDSRHPSADPNAPARITVVWDVGRGKVQLIVHASEAATEFGGGRVGGQPWKRYPNAEAALNHADGAWLWHNKYYVEASRSGPAAWVAASTTGVNSITGKVPGAAWSVNGTVRLQRLENGRYTMSWHGTGYPAQEVFYYPRGGGAAELIALRDIDPEALEGFDSSLEPGGGSAAAMSHWADCRMPNPYSMSCSNDINHCNEWLTSWDPKGKLVARSGPSSQRPVPLPTPVRGDVAGSKTRVQVTARPSPRPGQAPNPYAAKPSCAGTVRSVNYPDLHLAPADGAVMIVPRSSVPRAAAGWRIVRGLADNPGGISFESLERPGSYLRHQNYALKLQPFNDDPLYRADATFHPVKAPVGKPDPKRMAFRSHNFPDRYIRHYKGRLEVSSRDYRPGTPFDSDRSFTWESGF